MTSNKEHSSDSRYLDKLQFSPELRKTWLNYFVTNFRVVILLIMLITAWGLYSFNILPRESSPEVKIPIAVVTTLYPGASPKDVEQFVTRKIETELAGLKGLHKMTSNSYNSVSSITVEFDAKADMESSIRLLRDKVADAKQKISTDAEDPVVNEVSINDAPIWTISITGPYDGFTLRNYAEKIQDELEKISGVREINISGGDEVQFEVAYRPDLLQFYGISVGDANQAIVSTNSAIPSGNFDSNSFIVPIRTDIKLDTVTQLENIPLQSGTNGMKVLLKDVAVVREKAIKKTTYSRLSIYGSEPKNSVTLSLVKRQGASVLDTVDKAKETVVNELKNFPPGITFDVGTDLAKQVRKDFEQLTHDFLLTVVFVSIILFLIVGLKEALVAGLAIPLVFFVTFGMLQFLGISLNFLSLFSLILSLGLLVDDAIVVVSATKQYLNTGKFTPEEAVLLVLNDFKYVLLTTTLATVWAFLPLLFATGIIGEYLKSIPITVSITLIASLLVALMVNHPLAAVLERIRMTKRLFIILEILTVIFIGIFIYSGTIISIILAIGLIIAFIRMVAWYEKDGKRYLEANKELSVREWKDDNLIRAKLAKQGSRDHENFLSRLIHGILDFHLVLPIYEKWFRKYILDSKMRKKVLWSVIVLFILSVSLVPLGLVKSVFFPIQDSDYVFVDIRTPVGTSLEETSRRVLTIENELLKYDQIANMSTIVGRASQNSNAFGMGSNSSNVASVNITLKDKKDRDLKSYELADLIRRDLSDKNIGMTIEVSTLAGGPPSGAAFQAQISGDDMEKLSSIVKDLKPILTSISGVINVNTSQKDSVPEYTFNLDPIKLSENNLNASYVGSALRTAVSGLELTKIIRGEKEIKLIATFDERSIPDLSSIQNLQITNFAKEPIYLKDVADIDLEPAVDVITRIDQKNTIVLSAGADSSTNGQEILANFKNKIADYKMPSGYSIIYGGENEQNAESVKSVLRAMIIALVLIVSTLIIQFNSFRKALIVLVPIPLALIGVFIGMAIFNVPLSFPGLIGILALFGIVVKNAIILVDKINLNINSGIEFEDAVADAGKSRLEAIFITSFSTIVGILPITLSNELWRSLGGAVIFGLTLSSFLTLFIVPAFYLVLFKNNSEE